MFTKKMCKTMIVFVFIVMLSFLGCEKMVKDSPIAVEESSDVQELTKNFSATPILATPDIIVNTTSDMVDFVGAQQLGDLPGSDGLVSLREALIAANNTSGSNGIGFNIPTSDAGFDEVVFTIRPLVNPLPDITDHGTTIDGVTQTVFSGNTNVFGPEIVLDGSLVEDVQITEDGFCLGSSDNHIHSLVINSFGPDGDGIRIGTPGTGNNRVTGCFIGTDHTGTLAKGNSLNGIDIGNGPSNNVIGGINPGEGNLISGNTKGGVSIFNASNNTVQGNLIGTDINGIKKIPNHNGISIGGVAKYNTIGGVSENARNIISGNDFGIQISSPETEGNIIRGNFVGTDITGFLSISNAMSGILIRDGAHDNMVGGFDPGAKNIISGNGLSGIFISSDANKIIGNFIGTDVTGLVGMGNGEDGIRMAGDIPSKNNQIIGNLISGNAIHGIGIFPPSDYNVIQGNLIGTNLNREPGIGNGVLGIKIVGSKGNLIGGKEKVNSNIISDNGDGGIGIIGAIGEANENTVMGNTISHNYGAGISVHSPAIRNLINQNLIFLNNGLGIDLGNDGVTLNDPGDTDTGPNNFQNYPILTFALATPGRLLVQGVYDTPDPQAATIEFFANPVPDPGADPSGHGEGAVYLGAKQPNPNGRFTATFPPVEPGTFISATAMDKDGNTSEFSANIEAKFPGN